MKTKSAFIRVHPWLTLFSVLVLWRMSVTASERPRFESQQRDDAITIDGRYPDWYGNLAPFEQAPVAVQFLNDNEYLYLRITASASEERRQIVRQGFIV